MFNLPCEYSFSLLEVLDCIYDDISFHGSPSDNKKFIENLKEMVDEINEHPEQLFEMKFNDDGEIISGMIFPKKLLTVLQTLKNRGWNSL